MRLTERLVGASMIADEGNVAFGRMPVLVEYGRSTGRTWLLVMGDSTAKA
jgi:hypothetical protein